MMDPNLTLICTWKNPKGRNHGASGNNGCDGWEKVDGPINWFPASRYECRKINYDLIHFLSRDIEDTVNTSISMFSSIVLNSCRRSKIQLAA